MRRRERGPVVRTIGADVTAWLAVACLGGWMWAQCSSEPNGGGEGETMARQTAARRVSGVSNVSNVGGGGVATKGGRP